MENLVTLPSPSFWKGKRVLVTGHTGFKGSWLSYWLIRLGANVSGVGLKPITTPSLFDLLCLKKQMSSNIADILDYQKLEEIFTSSEPEIVFHLAAQPLVRESYKLPAHTFATNVMGTVHTLELIRSFPSVQCAVIITTDKVYENKEWFYPYRETDQLGGHDPYSASKAASEIVIESYRKSFFQTRSAPRITSARAGNIIGGGDWSSDRLVPDAIRAWGNRSILKIRRPGATRPWQHVLDPLNAYLILAEKTWNSAVLTGAYNFGPTLSQCATVRNLIELASQAYGNGQIEFDTELQGPHEANALSLDTSKAQKSLGVHSRWDLNKSVLRTINWYKRLSQGVTAQELCESDLEIYETTDN